jgi:hypothetical protein
MINRITGVEAPGNGRKALPDYTKSGPRREEPPWGELAKRVESFIGDHPVMSLAIGFTVGIVIGCLIKRR